MGRQSRARAAARELMAVGGTIHVETIGDRDCVERHPRVRPLAETCEVFAKLSFASECDALDFAIQLSASETRRGRFVPHRAFECPHGPHWHLTTDGGRGEW